MPCTSARRRLSPDRSAAPSDPLLARRLAADYPTTFDKVVERALVSMGAPESTPYFVTRLRDKPDLLALRDLAEIGENGRDAGPVLVDILASPDRNLRVGAARAMGYIGYTEGSGALIKLLGDPDDWRFSWVAAESLGRLHSEDAIPVLEALAADFWYPPVREAARTAIEVIQDKEKYPSRRHQSNFAFDFFEYEQVGVREAPDGTPGGSRKIGPEFVRAVDQLNAKELAKLSYDVEIAGYNEHGKHVRVAKSRPGCGLKVTGGFLVGSDRGEWGGELVFLNSKGIATPLIDQNVRGVYRMPFGILAVTGLAHLTINRGVLYRVDLPKDGKLKAALWKVLPGAPSESGMLRDGSLFIACRGGNVVVAPDGRMTMADPATIR